MIWGTLILILVFRTDFIQIGSQPVSVQLWCSPSGGSPGVWVRCAGSRWRSSVQNGEFPVSASAVDTPPPPYRAPPTSGRPLAQTWTTSFLKKNKQNKTKNVLLCMTGLKQQLFDLFVQTLEDRGMFGISIWLLFFIYFIYLIPFGAANMQKRHTAPLSVAVIWKGEQSISCSNPISGLTKMEGLVTLCLQWNLVLQFYFIDSV